MKCAIYARYSSEKQSPTSIDDQIRKCREYAARNEWQVLEGHTYFDEAISGCTDDRDGLKRMLAAASSRPATFDCILVDDTSRLSRKLQDTLGINEQLRFAGVRIVFVSQGIDSESEQAGMLTAVHGMVDELYIRELGKKTFRGVEGLAKRKLHTGGRCFGYRNVPIEDEQRRDQHGRPVINGVRLEVEPHQAKVVRRMFSMYAEGRSLKHITKQLNSEGVQSPQPQKGRISRSWCPSSVRTILFNERYRGIVVGGKKKKVRSPKTGKRVYKPRPEAEWVKTEIPEQRIISDDLWARSTARRGLVNRVYATANTRAGMPRSTAMNSPYLFSGLLKCSDCGANITILWGKGRNKTSQAYGCPMNWNRGETVGKNTVRIQRGDLEAALLGGLQELILREDVIDYVLEKFEVELRKALQLIGDEMEVMRRRKAELEAEIANLVTALAKGSKSPAIIGEITKREQEISDISDRLLSAKPDSIHSRIDKMRLMATAQMRNVRELLRGDVTLARAELLKHVSKIVLKPDGKTYVAEGNWKLLGDTTQGWCRGPESNVAASRSSRSH